MENSEFLINKLENILNVLEKTKNEEFKNNKYAMNTYYINKFINSLLNVIFISRDEINHNNPFGRKSLDDNVEIEFYKNDFRVLKYYGLEKLSVFLYDEFVKMNNDKKINITFESSPKLKYKTNVKKDMHNTIDINKNPLFVTNYNSDSCYDATDVLGLRRDWGDYSIRFVLQCKVRDLIRPLKP